MKTIIMMILKKLGTELLHALIKELADIIKDRPDSTMVKDADTIKEIVNRNSIQMH